MKTIFTLLSALLMQATLLKAQTPLPYYTGFDNPTETAGWQDFRKGNADPNFKWMYATFTAYSAPMGLFHHYPVGGTATTDDWFVSPGFNLPAGGRVDSIRSAFSGFGLPSTADTVGLYLLTGSPDPALATAKTLLLDYRGANYSNNDTWTAHTILLPSVAGSCYLAIRYKTVVNRLDVKFDNIKISAFTSTDLHNHPLQPGEVTVYPNPASQSLHIKVPAQSSDPFFIKIYNTLGELEMEQSVQEHEPLRLNLKNGAYFYTIGTDEGVQLKSGKLMIQHL